MPLLAMMYGCYQIHNEYDPKVVAHCARVAQELGADIIKVPYTGDIDSFSRVTESCCVPVVIAGGAKLDSTEDFLQMVHDSIAAGGAGLSVGRNVFQHHNVRGLVRILYGLVHEDWDMKQATEALKEIEKA